MTDSFLTISEPTEALLKEKASKFFAYAYQVRTPEEVDQKIEDLKKLHHKARHFCYAYFIGIDRQQFRANDDGEPSGTAGRPILGQLEKHSLTNTLVVVVRYFGGTKLGASGLIQAYKTAAALALDEAEIIEEVITGKLTITVSYETVGALMSIISGEKLKIIGTVYGDEANIDLEIRKTHLIPTINKLKALLLSRALEDINEETTVPGVNFSIIE